MCRLLREDTNCASCSYYKQGIRNKEKKNEKEKQKQTMRFIHMKML